MRLVFSGASGIGKTTLAHAIAENLNAVLLPENFNKIQNTINALSKAKIQRERIIKRTHSKNEHLAWLRHWEGQLAVHDSFVADRSPIDIFMQWNSLCLSEDHEEFQLMMDYCLFLTQSVDFFVLPPFARITEEIRNNANLQRPRSGENQIESHATCVGYHQLFMPERLINIPLQIKSHEDRVRFVLDHIIRK